MKLPNIRANFIPDPGYTCFDIDLDRADAQVVAWDSGCVNLKKALREGIDVHLMVARDVYGLDFTDSDIVEGTETHEEIKAAYKKERAASKARGHATNYLASPRTLARNNGTSEKQEARFQDAYFAANPEIPEWHDRIEYRIQTEKKISNIFGYHIHYFDRPKNVLTDAVAWIPQSTVGLITNFMWMNIARNLKSYGVQIWFQVHDSLVGQFPTRLFSKVLPLIHEQTQVIMPYDDPRAIPTGIKTSEKSWGECVDTTWNGERKK